MINTSMTYGEVEEFFASLMAPETPKMKKYHVYGSYMNRLADDEAEKVFLKPFENNPHTVNTVYKVSHDMAIVETSTKSSYLGFIGVYIDEKKETHITYYYQEYDAALIAVLAVKYAKSEAPVEWISKMIGLSMENK